MNNFWAIREKIPVCTHVFCALTEPYQEALKLAPGKVDFLQEGFDPETDYPRPLPKEHDAVFIGGLRGERADYHREVGFLNITDAYGDRHAEVVSQTRVNLNFTQGGTSDRTYKVLAAGGFLLTQRWPELERDFSVGVDLDVFGSPAELKEKIAWWLNHPTERERVAKHGCRTVQKFSRDNWATTILEKLTNNGGRHD
jgi:hypothetical protein